MSTQPTFEGIRTEGMKADMLNNPDKPTNNFIWKIIISGITSVLIGSFLALAIGVFMHIEATTLQLFITVFTASIGFLGGLLVKSPTQ